MLYLFKVYALVTVTVFGCSGFLLLAMLGWREARDYARARQAMRRIANPSFREPLAISRNGSRFHEASSMHLS